MKRKVEELSDLELESVLGQMGKIDMDVARRNLADGEIDLDADATMNRLLADMGKETTVDSGDVPNLPDSVRMMFEESKKQTFDLLAEEEAALSGSVYVRSMDTSPIAGPVKKDGGLLASIFRPAVVSWGICAAAIAVGIFVIKNNNERPAGLPILVATEASVLTPGKVTGFSEPTFTWETDNGGVVFVDVVNAESGAVVASLDRAFSPVRYSLMKDASALEAGQNYRVSVRGGEAAGTVLASQEFATVSDASGAPERAESLDGVIKQCENYLAANRAGDAWMLWAELTAAEKSDARMQELKTKILAELVG